MNYKQILTIFDSTATQQKAIMEYLKNYPGWARLNDTAWIVDTTKSHTEVRDEIREKFPAINKVIALDITSSGWGTYGFSDKVNDWLKNR